MQNLYFVSDVEQADLFILKSLAYSLLFVNNEINQQYSDGPLLPDRAFVLLHHPRKNEHPLINKKKVNFKYAVKINNNPITIKIFCNFASKLKTSYKRFLNNNFNDYFKIKNQKTKLIFTTKKNPYI